MTELAVPRPGRASAEDFVDRHLGHLTDDAARGSSSFTGGQSAADAALAAYDVAGYAARRNEVFPRSRRGASRLSPYIRHGLLSLSEVWDHVADGPRRDVEKFHAELLWQEYARHWYARLGTAARRGVRHHVRRSVRSGDLDDVDGATAADGPSPTDGWPRQLACLDVSLGELEGDGWLVNQARMWLASHWTVRRGLPWIDGEDHFFRHLLDGSRAANRLGWQWVTGAGSSKSYGFSRRQVERRAPGLCASCPLRTDCPIEDWPPDPQLESVARRELLRRDPSPMDTAGPVAVERMRRPSAVWLTAESLGRRDPALSFHPDLPAIFVFDEPLLRSLRLSSKRLVFLVETLAELGTEHDLELHLADPVQVLRGTDVAVTFAPVPGFRRRSARIRPAELHAWPWLHRPTSGSVGSFSAWRRSLGR